MIKEAILLLTSLGVLVLSGVFLVNSLNKLSKRLKISEFRAAFIIMAIATSIPELMVGISSAIEKTPIISLGNILGAGILDLTLITGILALLNKGIKFKREKIGDDVFFMFFSIILLIVLALIGSSLSRTDGFFLLFLFSFNLYRVFQKKEKIKKLKKEEKIKKKKIIKDYFIFLIALGFLLLSSKYTVHYSVEIASLLNVPKEFIGLFLISFGTVLPELIFGIDATLLKHSIMSIGNQVGTVFSNITLILGIVAVISPIKIDIALFLIPAIFLFFAGFMFTYFQRSDKEFTIKESVILILFYVLFTFTMILIEKRI